MVIIIEEMHAHSHCEIRDINFDISYKIHCKLVSSKCNLTISFLPCTAVLKQKL